MHNGSALQPWERMLTWGVVVLFSGSVAGASVFVILSKGYDDDIEKWAIGSIGTVLGFWFNQFTRVLAG